MAHSPLAVHVMEKNFLNDPLAQRIYNAEQSYSMEKLLADMEELNKRIGEVKEKVIAPLEKQLQEIKK